MAFSDECNGVNQSLAHSPHYACAAKASVMMLHSSDCCQAACSCNAAVVRLYLQAGA
jgi:hypothetical protein